MQLRSTPAERECKEPKFQTELLSTLFDCKDAKEVVWYDNRRTKEPEETQTGIPLLSKNGELPPLKGKWFDLFSLLL